MNRIIARNRIKELSSRPKPLKRVAVVIPLSSRSEFTADEQTSLRHLQHYLAPYDKFAVCPPDTTYNLPDDIKIIRMDQRYFGSAQAHALMQMSPEFYELFDDYEFIMIYHLDALVFSDQLLQWCDRGFDFIGAPWLPTQDSPWVEEACVGNSGFALMRVRSFLRVLYSPLRTLTFSSAWARNKAETKKKGFAHLRQLLRRLSSLRRLSYFNNNIQSHCQLWLKKDRAGDRFWSLEATRYWPDFHIATVSEALPFAFEAAPADCFERTGHLFPFGCHAWPLYDRKFWEPSLLPKALLTEA